MFGAALLPFAALAANATRAAVTVRIDGVLWSAAAGAAGLVGAGFFVAAGFIAASRALGPMGAALAFGAGFLVLAMLLHLLGRMRTRRRIAQAAADVSAARAGAVAEVIRSGQALMRGSGGLVLPAAAVLAGAYVAARR